MERNSGKYENLHYRGPIGVAPEARKFIKILLEKQVKPPIFENLHEF